MHTEFLAQIRALSQQYNMLPPRARVLVALSGGMDSMALLHALLDLREHYDISLEAAHFNHQLRGAQSARDEDFCRAHCAGLGLVLHCGTADVAALAAAEGRGIEESARIARYAFLEELAERHDCARIATAHHADDNLETLLLNLTRGTGLRGLSGIPPVRGRIVRPLLYLTRAQIAEEMARCQLPYVEDSSNAELQYSRNHLRHTVIPRLKEQNPRVTEGSAATLRALRDDEAYLSAQAEQLFRQAHPAEDGLVIEAKKLANAPRALALRALRRMLEEIEAPSASSLHLNAMLLIAAGSDPSAALHLPGGVLLQRVYGDLLLCWDHENEPLAPLPSLPVLQEGAQAWGDWILQSRRCLAPAPEEAQPLECYVSLEKLQGQLLLRARAQGDELALPNRRRKSLKKLMIEEKIPRRVRERIPVLADEDGPLLVALLGPARGKLAGPGEKALGLRLLPAHTERKKGEKNEDA